MDGREVDISQIKGGISDEAMREMQEKMDKEKAEIKARAQQDMEALMEQQNQTEEERQALREKLEKESKSRMEMENQRLALQNKLKAMEEKLIVGGEMASKAVKQEAELRQAEQELAQRKEKELALARQMADQEETNLELEEKFGSLQDEVDAKTKKLKKLWSKFQQSKTEIKDLTEEFQSEREGMLETIRDLTRQVKLKELAIDNFIPPEEARSFDDINNGGRAIWQEEEEKWVVPRLDITGNALRPQRSVSAAGLSRPETEYARQRKQYDANPRYKYDNVINLDIDMPERTTQDYDGPDMASRIGPVLDMTLAGDDDGEEVRFSAVPNTLGEPYRRYDGEGGGNNGSEGNRARKEKGRRGSRKDRPSTAGRRKKSSAGQVAEAKEDYPSSKGRNEYKG